MAPDAEVPAHLVADRVADDRAEDDDHQHAGQRRVPHLRGGSGWQRDRLPRQDEADEQRVLGQHDQAGDDQHQPAGQAQDPVDELAHDGARAGPSSRSMIRRSPGHASSSTSRGTFRAAYRSARATTTTSSSGPITGRNSGIRSIGESTHRPANPTASLALRGTAGGARSRRTVVTQAGRNRASSLAVPSGSRLASRISRPQVATMTATAMPIPSSHPRTTPLSRWGLS